MSIVLISELLAATADAHSPRAVVRAIASVLDRHLALSRVELGAPAPVAAAEHVNGEWRSVESIPSPRAVPIADGLAVVARRPLPAFCAAPEFREAASQVIAVVARHLEVIRRVARESQRA